MPYWLIPIVVLLGLLLLLGLFALLGRIAGGKYLRPILKGLMKVPLLNRGLQRMSRAALERSNPELASAVRKLERANVGSDPQRAQQALSRLSTSERRAYMDAVEDEGAMPEPMNRQQRRLMEKARKKR